MAINAVVSELVEKYVSRSAHVGDAAQRIAADLMAAELELQAAEKEIERLKHKISAGFIRKDVSHHYAPGWTLKKPLPDAVDDEWVKTGRRVA